MSGYIGTNPKKIGRGWIKIPSKNILDYIVTKDTSFSTDPIKVYYEKISDEYVVTSDTEMQSGKTYYEVHKLFEYTNRSVKNAWVGDDNKVPQLVLKSTYQREYTADNSDLVPSGYVNGDNFIFVNPFDDNEIHVFGAGIYGETGMNKHYAFKRIDDGNNYHYEWIKMNDLPYNISGSGMVLRSCTIDDVDIPYIYLLGGTYNKRAAYKYELEGNDEWIQQESIPYDFYNGVAFSINNDSYRGITLYGGSGGANIIYDAWFNVPGVYDISDIGGWTRRSDSGSYVNLPINFTTAYGNAPYRDVIFGTNATWQSCYAYINEYPHTPSIGAWYKLENPPESFKNAIIIRREFHDGSETYYKTLIICENNMYYFSIEWDDTDSKYHAYYEPVPQDGSIEAFFLPPSNPLNNKSVSNDGKWLFCQDGVYYNNQYSYASGNHINFEPFWKLTYKSNEHARSQDRYTDGLPYIISQGACGGNYFIGGFNGRGICELTDSGIPRYTRSIPYEFINGQACVVDGIVHLFGGTNSKKTHCTFSNLGSSFTYLSDLPIDLTYGSVIGGRLNSIFLFGDPSNDSTYKGIYQCNSLDEWIGLGNLVRMSTIIWDYIDNFEYVKVIDCNNKPYYLDVKTRKMFKGSGYNFRNWQFEWTEINKPLPIIDYESSRPCFVVDSSNVIHMIGGGSGNQRKKHYIFDTENESLGWQFVEDLPFNVKNGLALDLNERLWIISDDSCEYIEINYNRYFD